MRRMKKKSPGISTKPRSQTWIKALLLNREDELRRELILDLFCNFYLNTQNLAQRFRIDFAEHFAAELKELKDMEQDGLIKVHPESLQVTDLGRFFIRNICMIFDQYLERSAGQYSKTI